MYRIKETQIRRREESHNDTEITRSTYINGIIEILFIIAVVVSIKYPVALYVSLLDAMVAIAVNAKMIATKKVK